MVRCKTQQSLHGEGKEQRQKEREGGKKKKKKKPKYIATAVARPEVWALLCLLAKLKCFAILTEA